LSRRFHLLERAFLRERCPFSVQRGRLRCQRERHSVIRHEGPRSHRRDRRLADDKLDRTGEPPTGPAAASTALDADMTRVVGGWRASPRIGRGRSLSLAGGGYSSPILAIGCGETLLLVLLPVLASCAALVVSARTGSTTASLTTTTTVTTSTVAVPAASMMTSRPVVPADAALVYMSRGTSDRLRCPAEADPPTTLIVWSKDGRVVEAMVEGIEMPGGVDDDGNLNGGSSRLTISSRDNHLVISNVTSSDAGLYSCTAYSPLGSRRPTHRIMVVVKGQSPLAVFTSSYHGSATCCNVRHNFDGKLAFLDNRK